MLDVGRVTLSLAAATLAGFVLGWPARKKPGGIRVHFMVTFGSALFCATGLRAAEPGGLDVLRVVQGIVSGIGFVGAATVLKTRGRIYGVATATSIWISAAVGCEIALGSPLFAMAVSLFIAVSSLVLSELERRVFRLGHAVSPTERDEDDDA